MKQIAKRRFLSVSAAAVALLSLQSGMITASAFTEPKHFNWEYFSYVPSDLEDVNEVIAKFHVSHDLDFNGDTVIDVKDFYELEKTINDLYKANGYTLATAQQANPANDIDGDGLATPKDYCYLLKYFQKDFDCDINASEMTATITKYKGNLPTVVVPSKVFKYGRIFPVSGINSNAFKGNKKIETIVFSDYVQPFWSARRASGVNLDGYKLIPTAGTVTACTNLWLGDDAFKGCSNLKNVYLPTHIELSNSDVFADTEFIKTGKDIIDGVCYIKDSSGKVYVAYDIEDSMKNASSITFQNKTTAICTNVTKKLNKETLTDIQIPSGLEFIEDYAFNGFKNLETICGESYASFEQNQDANHQKILKTIKRYNCAFNNTSFLATATQEKVKTFANAIKDNCKDPTNEKELLLQLGKKFAKDTEYSTYHSLDRLNVNLPESDSNPFIFTNQFFLYPCDLYNTNDICRGSVYSASTAFIEGDANTPAYTECASFSLAGSLVMDQLGIRNYFCGAPGHALNMVFVKDKNDPNDNGKWYKTDLSGVSICDYSTLDYNNGWLFGGQDGEGNTWISFNDQFEMFPNSCNRQAISGCFHQIYNQYEDGTLSAKYEKDKEDTRIKNPEELVVEMYKPLTVSEQQALQNAPIRTQLRLLERNAWNTICGTEYYVGENGGFLSNCIAPDGYWVNADGSKGDKRAK